MLCKYRNTERITHKTILAIVLMLVFMPLNVYAVDNVKNVKPAGYSTSAVQSADSATDSVSAGYMGQLVTGLIIVIFCIVALAWVAKRFNRLQSTPDGSLRLLGGMSMGARERIVLVQVGGRQLLLGVAPGRINTLHVLDEPLETVAHSSGQAPARGFAEKLNAAIKRKPAPQQNT